MLSKQGKEKTGMYRLLIAYKEGKYCTNLFTRNAQVNLKIQVFLK